MLVTTQCCSVDSRLTVHDKHRCNIIPRKGFTLKIRALHLLEKAKQISQISAINASYFMSQITSPTVAEKEKY